MPEPLTWRVRLADGKPTRLVAICLASALAGAVGIVLFHNLLLGAVGLCVILASTCEFWWGANYRLDENRATARTGPSVSSIAWTEVRRLIVNDAGVTLCPLATESRLTPFRGVFLRAGEMGTDGCSRAIRRVWRAKVLNDWADEIPIEEAEPILKKLAYEIRKRKLETPAILLFESHKPLSFIGGQATLFFAPFLVPIVGYNNVRDCARLLNRRDSIDRLLEYLEGPMEAITPKDQTEVEA